MKKITPENFFSVFRRGSIVNKIGTLAMGVAGGQLVTLAASPLLTRMVDPSLMGVVGIFTSLSFLFGNVSSLRYDLGIVIAKDRTIAAALWCLCICTLLATLSLVTIAIFVAAPFIGLLSQELGGLRSVSIFIPFQVFAIGLLMATGQWASRNKLYKIQAQSQFTRAALAALLQLSAAFLILGVEGLVIAQILAYGVAAFVLVRKSAWPDRLLLRRSFSVRRMRCVSVKFKRLPIFSAPQDLLTTLNQNLPYFVLGASFGVEAVGLYWLTSRTMQLPTTFLSQAVRQVLLQHISDLFNKHIPVYTKVKIYTFALFVIGACIFLPVVFSGQNLFSFVFGQSWSEAGHYAQWVSIWMLTVVAKTPAWCVFHTLGRQGQLFAFESAMFAAQLSVLLVSTSFSPLAAIAVYTSVSTMFNFAMILFALRLAYLKDREL